LIICPKDSFEGDILTFHFSYFWFMNTNGPGNILTTISDCRKRLAGATPAFEAVLETAQDNYPFGSLMPGRKYNAGEYRFGFQGIILGK
jgi:hypothetical protein